jgi:ribokinase
MYDVVAIGDVSLDRFLIIDTPAQQPSKEYEGNNDILLEIGRKFPVKEYYEAIGGNACNTSVSWHKLGLKVGLMTILSDDIGSRLARRELEKEHLDTTLIRNVVGHRISASTILSFDNQRIIFSYHPDQLYQEVEIPETQWVYLTSMGKGCDLTVKSALKFTKNSSAKLAFNPGSYYMKHKLSVIQGFLKHLDILFANKEECQLLLDTTNPDIKFLLDQLLAKGVKMVVMTDGKNGSYIADGNIKMHGGIITGPILESTGAGDAFSAGFLYAHIKGLTLEECLNYGANNAHAIMQTIGASKGQLTAKELKRLSESRPIKIENL